MTKMDFELKGFPTFQEFGTSNIGQSKEKFGMNWLHKSIPPIIYGQGIFCFIYTSGKQFHALV